MHQLALDLHVERVAFDTRFTFRAYMILPLASRLPVLLYSSTFRCFSTRNDELVIKGQGIVGEIPGDARSMVHRTAKSIQKTNVKQKTLDVFFDLNKQTRPHISTNILCMAVYSKCKIVFCIKFCFPNVLWSLYVLLSLQVSWLDPTTTPTAEGAATTCAYPTTPSTISSSLEWTIGGHTSMEPRWRSATCLKVHGMTYTTKAHRVPFVSRCRGPPSS